MTAERTTQTYTPAEIHAGDYPIASESGIAGAALVYGQVVGRVAASRKVIPSLPNATDGSEVPCGIAAYAVAADGDNASWFTSGGYDIDQLDIGTWTEASLRAAFDRTTIKLVTTDPA